MAESQNKSSSTVKSAKKNSFLDLDLDKDFLTSWKSESVADKDEDFDIMPVSKGKKNSFNFGKMDMDFNLDGDFGKIPSFNLDIPGLDISSPPEKDGKPKEKSKKPSSENDKGKKADQDNYGFDFDDFGSFIFDPSPPKGGTEAQTHQDKDKFDISRSESGCQDIELEGSSPVKLAVNTILTEEVPGKTSLPGTLTTLDMKYQTGGTTILEPTMKIFPPKLAMDNSTPSKYSTVTDKFSPEKEITHPEEPIISRELSTTGESEESDSLEPVDYEAFTENVAVPDLPSNSPADDEPTGVNSVEALEKVDCVDKTATDLNEQVVNVTATADSTCDNKHTIVGKSQFAYTVAIPEKNNSINGSCMVESHGIEDKMTDLGRITLEILEKDNSEKGSHGIEDKATVLGNITSNVENSSMTNVVSGKISAISSGKENQESASEILSVSLCSEPSAELLIEKENENKGEPSISCTRSLVQSEKLQCHGPKALLRQTALSSINSNKKGFTKPTVVEKIRDWDSVQSDRKLVSFSSEHSKTPLKRELPQTRNQESFKGQELCGEVHNADNVQNAKKLNDFSVTKNLDMVKEKSSLQQIETSMNNPNSQSFGTTIPSSSVEIKKRTAQNSKSPITLPCLTSKKSPAGEKFSAVGGRKTTDQCGPTLSSLSFDSIKSPSQKDTKSVGKIDQTRLLKTQLDVSHVADSKRKTPTVSTKRKALEGFNAEMFVLNPSKRVSLSPIQNRKHMETSLAFSDKKASNHNNVEDYSKGSTLYSRQLSTSDFQRKTNIAGPEMSFSTENDILNPFKRVSLSPIQNRKLMETSIAFSDKKASNHNNLEDDINRSTLYSRQLSTPDISRNTNIEGLDMPFSMENDINIKQAEFYSKELEDLNNMMRKKHEEAKELLVRAVVNSNKLVMLKQPLFQLEEKIRIAQNSFAKLSLNSSSA